MTDIHDKERELHLNNEKFKNSEHVSQADKRHVENYSFHGEKNWSIADTWGMINDGNHRTIAKIIAKDSEEIECYVGRPK